MGRTKKSKALTRKITVRLSEEQYNILSIMSDYAGMSVSDLVRALIINLILKFKMGYPITLVVEEVEENEDLLSLSDQEESQL